jgi:hypothetical protein
MKTVKIPECMNPFEVIVNNQRYKYPGGTTQEVPDEVAEVIEVHTKNHADMTAPPYVPGGGGGGATCKLVVNASNNSYELGGTLYIPGYEDIELSTIIGKTEYEVPCDAIVVANTYNGYISSKKAVTEISTGSESALAVRVEADPGADAVIGISAYY